MIKGVSSKYTLLFFFLALLAGSSHLFAQNTDSVHKELLKYFVSIGAYEEAMNVMKAGGKMESKDSVFFFRLWREKYQLRFRQDSSNMASAESLKSKGLDDEALPMFRQLRSSGFETIRTRAIEASDSLALETEPSWYTEYPWHTFPLKVLWPWLGVAVLSWIGFFIYNRRKNNTRIDVNCRNKDEVASMQSSLQLVRNDLQTSFSEEQNSELINSGPRRTLPHLTEEVSENFATVISVVAPSEFDKVFGIIWKAGRNAAFKVNILIDLYDNDIFLTVRLHNRSGMIKEWLIKTTTSGIQEVRMDLAYQIFMLLRSHSLK